MTFKLLTRHLVLVLATTFLASCNSVSEEAPAPQADVWLAPDATTVEGIVPMNGTIESILRQQQVPSELAASMVGAIRGVFNPRDLQADRAYWVTRTLDGMLREFRYQIDGDNLLRVMFRNNPDQPASTFDVDVLTLPKEYRPTAVAGEITLENNSLIAAFGEYGRNVRLPLQLAEIFAGEVDFNSDLQLGDRFEVLFDRAFRDGEFVGYGEIQAAVLYVNNRRLSAYSYTNADGTASWYDEEGRSLRRQFLRTPLGFDLRVTSGFSSSRFHPVHGVRRPHLGVDFGAPTGTRVYAVASGVVGTAAWAGEAGRLVRIRHAGGYETAYLHLNGFGPGIRAGVRVKQGDVIGYVGSTGTATGPHLDYRVIKDGTYLNPMSAFSGMPAGEPISAEALPEFTERREDAGRQLRALLASGDAAPGAETASR